MGVRWESASERLIAAQSGGGKRHCHPNATSALGSPSMARRHRRWNCSTLRPLQAVVWRASSYSKEGITARKREGRGRQASNFLTAAPIVVSVAASDILHGNVAIGLVAGPQRATLRCRALRLLRLHVSLRILRVGAFVVDLARGRCRLSVECIGG